MPPQTHSVKIVEFAFVAYPATDLARARAFYEGVLGLEGHTSSDEGDGFWLEYEVGPHTLAIGNRPFFKPSPDGPHLTLEVADFDRMVEHLRHHQVQFALEPFDAPGCKGAIILDPDGNKLGIHQRKRYSR
jgi:catechol 2,3-dioxygenase-like lactoylglutathione lyase family enzyme